MKLPFTVDLSGEVVAISGGGGVLMSRFAKALATCGAKVGIIDISSDACDRVAGEIKAEGYCAVSAPADCMNRQSIEAAKAGVSNFTQWLAVHFASCGIRVNAIAPGFFSTAQNAKLLWNADKTPTARTQKIIDHTPMGRFGEDDDLLGTLLWLADDHSSGFVTGVIVPIDGGFSAYSGV